MNFVLWDNCAVWRTCYCVVVLDVRVVLSVSCVLGLCCGLFEGCIVRFVLYMDCVVEGWIVCSLYYMLKCGVGGIWIGCVI